MNLFRILGDAMHLLSIFVLIWKVHHTNPYRGCRYTLRYFMQLYLPRAMWIFFSIIFPYTTRL